MKRGAEARDVKANHRAVLGYLAWVGSSDTLAKVAVLLTSLAAARALSPDAFGRFTALYALALASAALWDAGISQLISIETAAGRLSPKAALRRALILRTRTFPIWLAVFALASLILAGGSDVSLAALLLFSGASAGASLSMVSQAGLRGHMRFGVAGACAAAGRFLTLSILALCFGLDWLKGLEALGVAFLVGEILTLALATAIWLRMKADLDASAEVLTLRRSAPFAVNGLLAITYNRLDVLIVASLASASHAGVYAVASRMQDALYILPSAIGRVSLPMLSRTWSAGSRREALHLSLRFIVGGVAVALPISLAAFLLAPTLVDLLLGEEYAAAVTPMRILIWFLPLAMVQAPLLAFLAARDRAADTTKVFLAAFMVAVGFHLALDWWAGANGGAVASLARDFAAMPLSIWLVFGRTMKPSSPESFPVKRLSTGDRSVTLVGEAP